MATPLEKRNAQTEWSAVLLALQSVVKHGIVPNIERGFTLLEEAEAMFESGGRFDLNAEDAELATQYAAFKDEFDGWSVLVNTPLEELGGMTALQLMQAVVDTFTALNQAGEGVLGLPYTPAPRPPDPSPFVP